MGVGNYRNDFNGSGTTLIVTGTYATSESDYQEYLDDLDAGEREEARPYEAWRDDQHTGHEDDLYEAVRAAAKTLGLTPAERKADFDGDFLCVAESDVIAVGVRGWQGDHIVAIAAADKEGTRRFGEPDAYRWQLLREYLAPVKELSDRYSGLVQDVHDYLKLALMQDGFQPRFPVGGYMSERYAPVEDAAGQMAEIQARVKAGLQYFDMAAQSRVEAASKDSRIALLVDLIDESSEYGDRSHFWDRVVPVRVRMPMYDPAAAAVVIVEPFDGEVEPLYEIPVADTAALKAAPALKSHLDRLSADGEPVPLLRADPMLQALFDEVVAQKDARFAHRDDVYFGADEIGQAWKRSQGDDFVVPRLVSGGDAPRP